MFATVETISELFLYFAVVQYVFQERELFQVAINLISVNINAVQVMVVEIMVETRTKDSLCQSLDINCFPLFFLLHPSPP